MAQPNPYQPPRDPDDPPIFGQIDDAPDADERSPLPGVLLRLAGVGCLLAIFGTAAVTLLLRMLYRAARF